jgi:hypothetical protein
MRKNEKPGATGNYPNGKLNEYDEGELAVAITADTLNRCITMDFGKQVAWISMTPEQAEGFAELLKLKASEVRQTLIFRKNVS